MAQQNNAYNDQTIYINTEEKGLDSDNNSMPESTPIAQFNLELTMANLLQTTPSSNTFRSALTNPGIPILMADKQYLDWIMEIQLELNINDL